MKRFFQILAILLLYQAVSAQIITVKQDSTGDYIHIQDAVNVANNGDTVLVWSGTYYENVVIEEKSITLGSLILTTGENTYINQTIINGNQTGSCIKLDDCYDTCIVNGFTMENGSGSWHGSIGGGGISIERADTKITNCKIMNNKVTGRGGGVYIENSYVFISNSNINNNHAYNTGGGIHMLNSNTVEFDSINKCNIYLNYAASGTDISKLGPEGHPLHVIVDTFTVSNPDYYYMYSDTGDVSPADDISFDINAGKITASTQNLYVSPNGNNSNDGFSSSSPLKEISFALLKMASDSLSPDTIHIANGIYSLGSGEKFPLSLKGFVSLQGENRDSTILDGENLIYILRGARFAENFKISNLTLQHGYADFDISSGFGAIIFVENSNTVFENLLFQNNTGDISSCGLMNMSNNVLFKNIDFRNNIGGKALRVGTTNLSENFGDTVRLTHCRFFENNPDYTDPEYGPGGAIAILGVLNQPDSLQCFLTNCLFVNNRTKHHPNGGYSSISIAVSKASAYLTNCTTVDNISENPNGANIGVTSGSKLHVYNSIMYNNSPAEIYMYTDSYSGPNYMNIYNSLLDGGKWDIRIYNGSNFVTYDDQTNIDADPFFLNKWEHPYQIDNGSPCIDAGTLANLPEFIELPEFDLAGNPRIVGDSIDMGAYEWNPTVGIDSHQYQPFENEKPKLLKAAPNPFGSETAISAKWDFTGLVQIEIYNNFGLRVDVLKSGQSHGIGSLITNWNGTDQNGNDLSAAIYHIVMFWNGEEVDGIKVVKK